MKEDGTSVLCETSSMISKGSLDIVKGLFVPGDAPTVMCASRSTEVKKTLEII